MATKDIPQEVGMEVLVVLRLSVAVGKLKSVIGKAYAYGGREPFAESHSECRLDAPEEVITTKRFADEDIRSCRCADKLVVGPGRRDDDSFGRGIGYLRLHLIIYVPLRADRVVVQGQGISVGL